MRCVCAECAVCEVWCNMRVCEVCVCAECAVCEGVCCGCGDVVVMNNTCLWWKCRVGVCAGVVCVCMFRCVRCDGVWVGGVCVCVCMGGVCVCVCDRHVCIQDSVPIERLCVCVCVCVCCACE